MRTLVMFLVSHGDDTDEVQAFAEDVAHLYGPPYVGVLDYAVRVDVPECFSLNVEADAETGVLATSNPLVEAANEAIALNEPIEVIRRETSLSTADGPFQP